MHYLPRFLLRQFAFEGTGDRARVWVHRRDKSFRTNVRGVGGEFDYYDLDVDEKLERDEGAHGGFLARVLQSPPGPVEDVAACCRFVAQIAARASAFRAWLTEAVAEVGRKDLERFATDEAYRHQFADALADGLLARLGLADAPDPIRQAVRDWNRRRIRPERVPELAAYIAASLNEADEARSGHNDLLKGGKLAQGCETEWIDARWRVDVATDGEFVLGDAGPISAEAEFRRPQKLASSTAAVPSIAILPISPTRCLVAAHSEARDVGPVRVALVNELQSAFCRTFFVSRTNDDAHRNLTSLIGSKHDEIDPAMVERGLKRAFDQFLREYPRTGKMGPSTI